MIEASYFNLCELYQTKSYNYNHDHFITNIFVNVKNIESSPDSIS